MGKMRSPYAVLIGEIIAHTAAKKRQREQFKKALELQIKLLEDKHKRNPDTAITSQLKKECSELHKLLTAEIARSLMFTKQKQYDGGIQVYAPEL